MNHLAQYICFPEFPEKICLYFPTKNFYVVKVYLKEVKIATFNAKHVLDPLLSLHTYVFFIPEGSMKK